MFTRYSGIEVPKNYSGNRFRRKSIEETDTKIHKSQPQDTVKSSISPSFEQAQSSPLDMNIMEQAEVNYENEDFIENVPSEDEEADKGEEKSSLEDSIESSDNINNTLNDEVEQTSKKEALINQIKSSPISDFLRFVKGDDLLLISLIVMLASEKSLNNYDIIILLALLLVYHT